MQLIIILCAIFIVTEGVNIFNRRLSCSEGVHVHGRFHRKEVLAIGIDRPYQLSFINNKTFFSFNVGDDSEDKFQLSYVSEPDHEVVPLNITNGFATAIDHKNEIIFLGGSDGIYTHNYKTGHTEHIVKHHNIWDMFYKEHELYFIQYQTQQLHKHNRKTKHTELVEHIKERIYQFIIDGDSDTFITTKAGLYEIKNGTHNRLFYDGPITFRALEVDHKGQAYFCGLNGIYVANKTSHELHEVAKITHIFGLTFDNDNRMIYSNPHEIVKLIPDECED